MILKIGSRKLDMYNDVAISLQYDSIASTYAFSFYFDPDNADHREMFRPCTYQAVTIEHEGELLFTGTLLSEGFKDGPRRELMAVAGYSKTGVLEDCEIPTSAYPLQSNGINLRRIAEKCIKPFGISLVVSPSVADRVNSSYTSSTASDQQTVKEYLSSLAGQKHVMLTHDEWGNLVLTEANINAAPVFDFNGSAPATEMELQIDGQKMHSGVTMIKQQTKGRKDGSHKNGNAGQSEYTNPYVQGIFRPRVNRQTSGRVVDTSLAARNMLSEELKDGISLRIELDRWTLGGKLVRPNSIVTVTNPTCYLYKKTRWFIAGVEYRGNNESETATLTCCLPEVFGTEQPKNIFA